MQTDIQRILPGKEDLTGTSQGASGRRKIQAAWCEDYWNEAYVSSLDLISRLAVRAFEDEQAWYPLTAAHSSI